MRGCSNSDKDGHGTSVDGNWDVSYICFYILFDPNQIIPSDRKLLISYLS